MGFQVILPLALPVLIVVYGKKRVGKGEVIRYYK